MLCDTPDDVKTVLAALEVDKRVVRITRFKNQFRDLDPTHFRRLSLNIAVEANGVLHVAGPRRKLENGEYEQRKGMITMIKNEEENWDC